MSTFFPLGGLINETQVFLGYFQEGTLYVLTLDSNNDFVFKNPIVILDDGTVTINSTISSTTTIFDLIILSVGSLQLNGTPNLGVDVNNLAVPSDTQTILSYQQTQVQDWTNPPSILTGVAYLLSATQFLFEDMTTRSITPYFIPTTVYYGCTSTATQSLSSLNDIIRLSYCSIENKLGTSSCSGIPVAAWTNAGDCVNGFPFRYAPIGLECAGIYKSTCPNEGEICTYTNRTITVELPNAPTEGINGTEDIDVVIYECRTSKNVSVDNTQPPPTPGFSWWVIILIIFVVLILIAILVWSYKMIIERNAQKMGTVAGESSDVRGEIDTDVF